MEFTGTGLSSIVKESKKDAQNKKQEIVLKNLWNTEKFLNTRNKLEQGEEIEFGNPFFESNLNVKKSNLVYDYSKEEMEEIQKCRTDIIYFAEKYCKIKNEYGKWEHFKLREYQKNVLKAMTSKDKRFIVYLASRQVGKSVMTGIAINHYVLFEIEKNIMCLANKGETMEEIIEKIWMIHQSLPYFLKPGILKKNQSEIRFDNDCKIFGQATTKSASIGFTIDYLFTDEFAHIPENIAEPFYRSVLPTLSSLKESRMVITSTANGLNKFHEIYTKAVKGENSFYPLTTFWYEVPGRDEEWKKVQIADLGSEDLFNQEYGCQFLVSSSLLLDSDTLISIREKEKTYERKDISYLTNKDIEYDDLVWDSSEFDRISEKKGTDCYIISVDLSKGVGKDYSVMNIFRLDVFDENEMSKLKKVSSEKDFIKFRQIGIYRNNKKPIRDVVNICSELINFLGIDNTKIIIENNLDGEFFYELMKETYSEFYSELFFKTKVGIEKNRRSIIGVRVSTGNKTNMCLELKRRISLSQIIFNEQETINEMLSFGLTKTGTYASQIGHDDIAMTMVNINSIYDSPIYADLISEVFNSLSLEHINSIYEHIEKNYYGNENKKIEVSEY